MKNWNLNSEDAVLEGVWKFERVMKSTDELITATMIHCLCKFNGIQVLYTFFTTPHWCRQLKLNKAAFNLRIYRWSTETQRALRVINETRSTATISGGPIGLILYRRSSSNRDSRPERMCLGFHRYLN
jgi:hypothetical protein